MPAVPLELLTAQYELKCTYVSTQLENNGYVGLFEEMEGYLKIIGSSISWSNLKELNIAPEAYEALEASKSEIGLYLCHPNVLLNKPSSLKYYRCISVFSQKGLKTVSRVSSIEKAEAGKDIVAANAAKLAGAINRNLSPLYKIIVPPHEKLKALMYATAGITFDGGWKNAIGTEGERVIKSIIIRHAFENDELVSVTIGDKVIGAEAVSTEWIDRNAGLLKAAMFKNGSTAEFSSEPDVTLLDSSGKIVAGIEVKAGLDPAGALERHGAMLKSFDTIIKTAPSADRILVIACVTDEVEKRLKTSKSVSRYYSLTDIMLNAKDENEFANIVRGTLGLVVSPS